MEVRPTWLVLAAMVLAPLRAAAQVDTDGARMFAEGLRAAPAIGAASGSQYVQLANGAIAIFGKDGGGMQLGPLPLNAIYARAQRDRGARACALPQSGPSSVLFDHIAQRWILSHTVSGNNDVVCLAVSASADAAGVYYRYALPVRARRTPSPAIEHATLALWPDAIYLSLTRARQVGSRICGVERRALMRGADATIRCRDLGPGYHAAVPASLQPHSRFDAGKPALFLALDVSDAGRGERLVMWRYSFSRDALSSPVSIPVAPFSIACPEGACIKQPPGGSPLPAHADRLAPGIAYQGDALLLNHTVAHPNGQAALRWYEIRRPHEAPHVYQYGTFAPDEVNRWMGAIGMDKAGNIALGYAVAAGDTPPGIRYTGRLRTDAPGHLRGEEFIVNGHGVQSNGALLPQPGGALSLDPADGCTFWYTQQYVPRTGPHAWRTHISSFKFRNCK
jgi:hypothetical protein